MTTTVDMVLELQVSKLHPNYQLWGKILKNSHYGSFSHNSTVTFPGSILSKMVSALHDQAASCERFVPPRRKLLVKHFPHKINVEIPHSNAMDALVWCMSEYQERFTLRASTTSRVEFIVKSHAAQIYLKTAFG